MDIEILSVWRRLFQLGSMMFPSGIRSYRHRIALATTALIHFPTVRAWYEKAGNSWLSLARERVPLMDGAIYVPYLNRHWSMARRLAVIDQHYRMLTGPVEILAQAITERVELVSFHEEYPGLRLVLDRASWLVFEGEVVLNLFVGEVRYYSLAFALGLDADESVILVGALQGAKAEEARDTYRAMTRALHGMRPRDLLLSSLQLLAVQFGVRRIWAISNDARQCCSAYYGKSRKEDIHANLDQVWIEHGGEDRGNGFFEIPVELRRRSLSEIPSSKRSVYRRRYRMLERVAQALEAACAAVVEQGMDTEAGELQVACRRPHVVLPKRLDILRKGLANADCLSGESISQGQP